MYSQSNQRINFGIKKKEVTTSEVKKDEKLISVSKPSLLLPARQQNINIVLGKLRLLPVDIIEALILYNEIVLKQSTCELIL